MLDQTYAKLWFDRTLIAPYFSHEGKIEFMVLVSLMAQLLAGRANLQLHYLDQYLTSFLSSISEGKIRIQIQQTNSEPDLWKLWNLLHKRAISTTMETASSEQRRRSSFQHHVTARTPISKKATKLSTLVDSTYLKQNHKTFINSA